MASIPGIEGEIGARLRTIEGQPPDLAHLPPGCPFAPRCRFAADACTVSPPSLESVGEDHYRACYRDG